MEDLIKEEISRCGNKNCKLSKVCKRHRQLDLDIFKTRVYIPVTYFEYGGDFDCYKPINYEEMEMLEYQVKVLQEERNKLIQQMKEKENSKNKKQ